MAFRLDANDGQPHILIPNGRINGELEGIRLLSGVVAPADAAAKYLGSDEVEGAEHMTDYKMLVSRQESSNGLKTKWLHVSHRAYANMLERLPAIKSDNTRMSAKNVYLADADADTFIKVVKGTGIDYDVIEKPSTAVNSRINKYTQFSTQKLLVNYYEGRVFVNEENGDISTIQEIVRKKNMTRVKFMIERGEQHFSGMVTLATFADRHTPAVLDEKNNAVKVDAPNNIDRKRFIVSGQHPVTPDAVENSDYFEAIGEAVKVSEKAKKTPQKPSSPNAH